MAAYALVAILGATANLGLMWSIAETFNGLMAIPNLTFGPEYFIPKPVDPRLITEVSMAVAKAAMESGVARKISLYRFGCLSVL